jgi:N-terminal domain of CBF1 interacting co-repressor CIR
MVQGLAFLSKKSWHTKNLNNQEKVWIAEEQAKQEQIKTTELARQIQQEREEDEINQIAGGCNSNKNSTQRKLDRGIDWMYHGQSKNSDLAKEDATKQAEEFLLGKAIPIASILQPGGDIDAAANRQEGVHAIVATVPTNAGGYEEDHRKLATLEDSEATQRNESFRLRYEDPMYHVSLQSVRNERKIEQYKELYNKVGMNVVTTSNGNSDIHTEQHNDSINDPTIHNDSIQKKKKKKERRKEKRYHSKRSDDEKKMKTSKRRRSERDDDDENSRSSSIKQHHNKSSSSRARGKKKYSDDDSRSSSSSSRIPSHRATYSTSRATRKQKSTRRHYHSDNDDDHDARKKYQSAPMDSHKHRRRRSPSYDDSYQSSSSSRNSRLYHRNSTQYDDRTKRSSNYDRTTKGHDESMEKTVRHHDRYGLQYTTDVNGKESSSTEVRTRDDYNNIGPDPKLLRQKKDEKYKERQRIREHASQRQYQSLEERAAALRAMEENAHSYEKMRKDLSQQSSHDDDHTIRHREGGATFLNQFSQEVHGIPNNNTTAIDATTSKQWPQNRKSNQQNA